MRKGQYQLLIGIIVLTSIVVSIGLIYYFSFKPKIEINQTTSTTTPINTSTSITLSTSTTSQTTSTSLGTTPASSSTTTYSTTTTTTIPLSGYFCDSNLKKCEVYPPEGKNIQDAINLAQAGWTIHLNPGTYYLNDTQYLDNGKSTKYGLRISKNITMKGSGIDNTILQLTNFSIKSVIYIRDFGSGTTLENLTINGNKKNCENYRQPCENASAIGLDPVSDVTLRNIYIYNIFHGIFTYGNSSNALKNILVSSVKLRDLWRNGTEFYDFPYAGYAVHFNYVNDSKIEKIDLDTDKQVFSAGDAVGIYNSFNITIENSVIKKSATAGVYVAYGTTVSQFITIKNNVFDGNWNTGIDINRGRFINVSNNTISNSKYAGIGIHSTTDSFFVGNRIFNIHFAPNKYLSIEPSEEDKTCGNSDYWKASYAAIPIWSMACFDGDPKYPGYFTSERNVIKNNTLENVNRGIRISWENTTGNRIEDNLIINYSIYCILDLDSNTLSNNTCR